MDNKLENVAKYSIAFHSAPARQCITPGATATPALFAEWMRALMCWLTFGKSQGTKSEGVSRT